MAARKTKAAADAELVVDLDPADPVVQVAQVVTLDDGSTTTIVSSTGIELDPVDGRPVFADGMSRRRWLEVHAEERHAELVAQLRAEDPDGE